MDQAVLYLKERTAHWDATASGRRQWLNGGACYHKRLQQVLQNLLPPGLKVLEIGCGAGDLLASVNPALGVGVDISCRHLAQARARHPRLRFALCDGHRLGVRGAFDAVIISDLVNDLWDVQALFTGLAPLCSDHTRIIVNSSSKLWEIPLTLAIHLRLCTDKLRQNWLTVPDIVNLLALADFEVVRRWREVLCPFPLPLISQLCNKILVKLPFFSELALTNLIVARFKNPSAARSERSVSVVIPARNEEGNIERIFSEMPRLGSAMELIFVEGNSSDRTRETIRAALKHHPEFSGKLVLQQGKGKGDAVRLGFSQARHDILIVLDADCTVPPGDLVRFYRALLEGKGEFINGVRLVYPMGKKAMQVFNLIANKLFGGTFSWLLDQPVKDTLCGTKALWRADYESIAKNRAYFGDFDPFGDFDLLFGAARLNLKITDMPVRYAQRSYGATNISRWRHGLLLLRMVAFALNKIKFV
ncbi:MAG: bifunctional class I SAM-dependent methyltransferase/glycosyltransferase family 2 protein [Chitinivibrionales bacterium]|nr:bifunctional class I SAM-dependent methyltransferase/glycosyltransferase family 2 protein [Chitinivibrionales bacterium]